MLTKGFNYRRIKMEDTNLVYDGDQTILELHLENLHLKERITRVKVALKSLLDNLNDLNPKKDG